MNRRSFFSRLAGAVAAVVAWPFASKPLGKAVAGTLPVTAETLPMIVDCDWKAQFEQYIREKMDRDFEEWKETTDYFVDSKPKRDA